VLRSRKKQEETTSRDPQPVVLERCLAKTVETSSGAGPGYPVREHCLIVGEVARELLGRMPPALRQVLFPEGSELVAAVHDVGKVCPTFQYKLYRAIGEQNFPLPGLDRGAFLKESVWGGHPGVSQVTLEQSQGGSFIPQIAGLHHGYVPRVAGKLAGDHIFGGPAWQASRELLLDELKSDLGCDWPHIEDEDQARAIAGLTTVADWIGSGAPFDQPRGDWRGHIATAVDSAGFIKPDLLPGLEFESIFGFSPWPAQQRFYQRACRPGVHVLEAPMGMGKTEAALYAAYLAMSRYDATGLYFALPTQLTSEKIHERVGSFLDRVLSPESSHRVPRLLHGNAWLKRLEMGEEGRPGHQWFDARKRGILAPFAVGTVDQALMAVMNVRHGFVRAFGLAGKVVILDEVHSYDAYTGLLLDELVAALRRLRCTVIILSATLIAKRREALLQQPVSRHDYPLVTTHASLDAEAPEEIPVPGPENRIVSIRLNPDSEPAMEEALSRAHQGQQVLWIENSVKEAQECYATLAARGADMDVECGLLHSRFTPVHRQQKEDHWVGLFGRQGRDKRRQRGRILVGTQVLEQSLDIDADFLVSRIAPTDMLLQRLGRLWRHHSTPRPDGARREAWLLAPSLREAVEHPYQIFGPTAHVYYPYVLCRTLEVWQELREVILPEEIRALIEATYEERKEPEKMARLQHELEHGNRFRKGRQQLRRLARIGISSIGDPCGDDEAATRYSDHDSIELLLLRAVSTGDGGQTRVTLLDGEKLLLPRQAAQLSHRDRRRLAAALQRWQLRVPPEQAPDPLLRKSLSWLAPYLYLGGRESDWARLRVAVVRPDGELQQPAGEPVSGELAICYDELFGYRAEKYAN